MTPKAHKFQYIEFQVHKIINHGGQRRNKHHRVDISN